MPIYEYRCESCEKVSEFSLKFSDPQPTSCPACAKGPLKKIISQTAFVLKGGGWYADAYSSKPPASSTKTEAAPEAAESKATSESKPSTESKPTTEAAPAKAAAKPASSAD